jgi:hypothetical protein
MPQTLWQKQYISSALSQVCIPSTKATSYLEHLNEKENLGVFEIDRPSARDARDDGVDE